VNLGLIPSSEAGWATACAALRVDSGGVLHVHASVTGSSRETTHSAHVPTCDLQHCRSETETAASNSDDDIADDDSCDDVAASKAVSADCEHTANNDTEYTNQRISGLLLSTAERKAETSAQCGNSSDIADANACKRSRITSTSTQPSGVDSVTAAEARVRTMKFAKTRAAKPCWREWAERACETLRRHLSDMQRRDWSVAVRHIEHVKSYAPHVDHIVVDVQCRPPL